MKKNSAPDTIEQLHYTQKTRTMEENPSSLETKRRETHPRMLDQNYTTPENNPTQ
jgi:hypothetical protein